MVSDHNGSEMHRRYKRKMANLLRDWGYTVFGDSEDDEVEVRRDRTELDGNTPPYYVDVCAVNSSRIVCVEIDGYKGHRTRRAILKDKHRFDYIAKILGADVYRFAFYQLMGMDRKTIEEELELTKGSQNAR